MPTATYILTDFDRLSPWELELAANFYLALKAAGLHVLNNPAKFLPRHALLERLRQQELSNIGCWSPAMGELPDRFPVFLRTQAAHRGTITELLASADEARMALDDALSSGYAVSDLLFVEFAAEKLPQGLYRKHSYFRIGESYFPWLAVHTPTWVGKENLDGHVPEELYEEERAGFVDDPFAEWVPKVFEIASIDYGRIDFGVVGGAPQAYEINTNPWLGNRPGGLENERLETRQLAGKLYVEALEKIDSPLSRKRISLDRAALKNQRHQDGKWLWTRRWTP